VDLGLKERRGGSFKGLGNKSPQCGPGAKPWDELPSSPEAEVFLLNINMHLTSQAVLGLITK